MINKKLILASQSPRRRELMSLLDIPYQVKPASIDEEFNKDLSIEDNIKQIAYNKSKHRFDKEKDAIVIGADTIVINNDNVLGKPLHKEDAKTMLKELSGASHEVWTAVSIVSENHQEQFINKSEVSFYELDDEEINKYVESGESLDKAGGYNINGKGALFIQSIKGDNHSIMGLPISRVYQELKNNKW